jgi:hypothetical protein
MPFHRPPIRVVAVVAAVGLLVALLILGVVGNSRPSNDRTTSAGQVARGSQETPGEPSVELTAKQLQSISIAAVGTARFPIDKDAVGSIAYDGHAAVPVFSP